MKEYRMAEPEGVLESRLRHLVRNHKLNMAEQYEQWDFLQSRPLHVAIPTGNRCNLRCSFCTDRDPSIEYTDLTFDQFLRFTEPLECASLVQLYGWGEPFVNPDYERIFDYVTKHYTDARLYISTNGVLLTDRWIDKILAYGKCLINVSLNAATRETYARITQADLFRHVIDNVDNLMGAIDEREDTDLVISLSFVAIKPNVHELPRFIALSDELGIRYVIFQDLNILEDHHRGLFVGENEAETHQLFLAAVELAQQRGIYLDSFTHYPVTYFSQDRSQYAELDLPRDCLSTWEQDDDTLFYPQPGECYEPYQTFLISQNGAVTTCCRAREVMGTINTFRPPEACTSCPVKLGCDVR
jgi:MoaA/NifB/PqqE/SkfB family radical SAM enzyme